MYGRAYIIKKSDAYKNWIPQPAFKLERVVSVGQDTAHHHDSGLPSQPKGGPKNKLCFNNSLHQTAESVRLSPVCIKPVSELRPQFNSDSSGAAVRLSPELSNLNKDSSESTESEQLYSVTTHDQEFEHIEMTLNNEPVVVGIDKQEYTVDRSKETEDYHPQQLSEDDQLQDSLDNQSPYSEDFDSPDARI